MTPWIVVYVIYVGVLGTAVIGSGVLLLAWASTYRPGVLALVLGVPILPLMLYVWWVVKSEQQNISSPVVMSKPHDKGGFILSKSETKHVKYMA